MPEVAIRPARPSDLREVVAITNHYIRGSTCTMKETDETVEERLDWMRDHGDRYPLLVAEIGNGVVGWGALTPHSDRSGYRYTVHDAVYIRDDLRGRGIGTAMLQALISEAKRLGYKSVVAVIEAEQPASLALHHKLGFKDVARLEQVGFKFGRWLDVMSLQLLL